MHTLWQDLTFGLRLLVRQRGFTAVVVTTLALAIGANTVIFSIASFLLLRPLPFADRDTLVALYAVNARQALDRSRASAPDVLDWREQATSYEQIGAFADDTATLTGRGEPLRLKSQRATANLLDLWGIDVARGRGFEAGDDRPGAAPVVLLSHGFWQRQFAGDPGLVGQSLTLDGVPHVVIGILPAKLEIGTFSLIDVWTPLALDPNASRTDRRVMAFARLRPGVTPEQATVELEAIAARQAQEHPATHDGWSAQAMPLLQAMTGANAWIILSLLGVVVLFVLLIACANVANLMLARAVVRQKELAVRAALGAGRLRVVRQLVTESLLLGLAGGAAGLALGYGGLRVMRAVAYEPFFQQITIDARVLAFVGALSILTPVVFGLLPALHAARGNLAETMNEGAGRTSGGRRGRRHRSVLVVAQLSLAATLLVLSTLIIRTAVALAATDYGFDPSRVLSMRIELDGARYPDDASAAPFVDGVLARLETIAGVTGAAAGDAVPVFSQLPSLTFAIDGRPPAVEADRPWARVATVSPGHFATFDIPVLRGRPFVGADRADAPGVVLVSAEAARRYWPDGDAIGRRIRLADDDVAVEVVGIVGDVFNRPELGQAADPQIYRPLAQHPRRALALAVRTSAPPATLVGAVRAAVRAEAPDQALYDVRTMAQTFHEQLASDRLIFGMFAAFALVALALASGGLYGLMSYSVAQRSQEFGVRLALGARTADVIRHVVRQGLTLAVAGVLVGAAGGFALAQLVANMLVGVGPGDPATYAGVAAALLGVAALASYLPARRVLGLDPIRALRR